MGSHLLDDTVPPEAGDEFGGRGDGEVPLQIHLPVLTAALRQVQPGHARPATGRERHQQRVTSQPGVLERLLPAPAAWEESVLWAAGGLARASEDPDKTLPPPRFPLLKAKSQPSAADPAGNTKKALSVLPAPHHPMGSLQGCLAPAAKLQRKPLPAELNKTSSSG